MSEHCFDSNNDISELANQVILITDGTTITVPLVAKTIQASSGTAGLSKETIYQLTKHNPAEIYFTGRKKRAAEAVVVAVKHANPSVIMTFVELDLPSLSSIKAA